MKTARIVLIAALVLGLTACGTTSSLQRAPGSERESASLSADRANHAGDFSRYTEVLVRDFGNQTKISTRNAAKREVAEAQAITAGKRFADQIAAGLKSGGSFEQVLRDGEPGPQTLVIQGDVTKYKKGNAALRMMIGLGAGSSNFDARVAFVDGATGEELSFITVDKNSWFLGGAIAATQTADDFIDGAATKVAEETIRAKQGGR